MLGTYQGSCHCKRIKFRVTGNLALASECNCSICTKKGFLHLIVPRENFHLESGADALTTYQFNTGVAHHTFCKTCGIHAFYIPRSDPKRSMSTSAASTNSTSPPSVPPRSTEKTGNPP